MAILNTIKLEFNIIYVSKIGNIIAKVINKIFTKFIIIEKYCQAYQEAYNNIVSWFTNKNEN